MVERIAPITGPTGYDYGRTPGLFDIAGLLDAFTPTRREIVSPSQTRFEEMDGLMYPVTTPAVYGEPETGIEYMPAYRAASSAADYLGGLLTGGEEEREMLVEGAKAVPGALAGQIDDYYTAMTQTPQGAAGLVTPEGEVVEANPLLPMEYLLGGSIGAMRAGDNVLGAAGGSLTSPEKSRQLGKFISQNTYRNPKKLAKEAKKLGLLDGVSDDDFYSELARIKELQGQRISSRQGGDPLELAGQYRPKVAQKNKLKNDIRQSPMFESWTEKKRSLVLNSPDRQMVNDQAMLATVDAISREAKKRGLKVYHTSKGKDGKASSRYIETPDGRRVRVSDHALPDTLERQHKRSVGVGVLSNDIVVDDWRNTSIDEYLSQILSPDFEASFGDMFRRGLTGQGIL